MANVKDFNEAFVFTDLVVDQNGAMDQFAHAGASSNDCAHARKASQQLNVVEKGVPKARGCFRIIFRYVADDIGEIG